MQSYAPGQVVNQAGVYKIVQGCPACPAELALVEGERFPACTACTRRRYLLHAIAEPIENDPDFR